MTAIVKLMHTVITNIIIYFATETFKITYSLEGFTVLTPQLLRLLQVRNESKRNPIYGSRFYSAYEKYYKNNRNTK